MQIYKGSKVFLLQINSLIFYFVCSLSLGSPLSSEKTHRKLCAFASLREIKSGPSAQSARKKICVSQFKSIKSANKTHFPRKIICSICQICEKKTVRTSLNPLNQRTKLLRRNNKKLCSFS